MTSVNTIENLLRIPQKALEERAKEVRTEINNRDSLKDECVIRLKTSLHQTTEQKWQLRYIDPSHQNFVMVRDCELKIARLESLIHEEQVRALLDMSRLKTTLHDVLQTLAKLNQKLSAVSTNPYGHK